MRIRVGGWGSASSSRTEGAQNRKKQQKRGPAATGGKSPDLASAAPRAAHDGLGPVPCDFCALAAQPDVPARSSERMLSGEDSLIPTRTPALCLPYHKSPLEQLQPLRTRSCTQTPSKPPSERRRTLRGAPHSPPAPRHSAAPPLHRSTAPPRPLCSAPDARGPFPPVVPREMQREARDALELGGARLVLRGDSWVLHHVPLLRRRELLGKVEVDVGAVDVGAHARGGGAAVAAGDEDAPELRWKGEEKAGEVRGGWGRPRV